MLDCLRNYKVLIVTVPTAPLEVTSIFETEEENFISLIDRKAYNLIWSPTYYFRQFNPLNDKNTLIIFTLISSC